MVTKVSPTKSVIKETPESLVKKKSKSNVRLISPEDSPYLVRDKEEFLIAGLKLEAQVVSNDMIKLSGWLFGSPDIVLLCGGKEVAAEVARFPRDDVVTEYSVLSDFPSGFDLIYKNPRNGDYILRWRISDNGKTKFIDFLLAIEPTVFELPDQPTCHGTLDGLHDMVFAGWAWDPNSPHDHLLVEFILDGAVIGQAPCETFREDLRQAGIGDGTCGFKWAVPEKIDPSQASRIKVRIKNCDVLLNEVLVPTFSSLTATRCFSGDIDFSWPYYVSGVIIPKTRSVPDHLEFISGDNIVAEEHIVPDFDVKSSTYGAGKFNWKVPTNLINNSATPVQIRLPDCGILKFVWNQSTADILGGIFAVSDNTVHGRMFIAPHSKLSSVTLRIVIGHQIGGFVSIDIDKNSNGKFSFQIPHQFLTGEEHLIGVLAEPGNVPFRTETGQLEYSYTATAFGSVDKWDSPYIYGWAIDNSANDDSPLVQLYDGEVLISETSCALDRADVSSKFKRSGKFGFEIAVPEQLFCGKAHRLHIKCGGAKLHFGQNCQIPDVLENDDLKAIKPQKRIKGRVEHLTTELVAGWAWDVMRPEMPVDLVVRVDGHSIGTTRAHRFSSRLRGYGRSGHQQFIFRLPAHLQNGSKRHVTVEEANTRFELANNVSPISFPLVAMAETDMVAKTWNYSGSDLSSPQSQGYERYLAPKSNVQQERDGALFKISMIALNWNGDTMIEDFLASLERNQPSHPYELLIVDHGSIDNSIEIIKQYAKRLPIQLIERHANYSFSASNNYAADLANGEYLLFLNNDLIFQHDCIGSMAELLADTEVGVVGAKLLEPLRDAGGNWVFEPHHEGVRFKIDTLPGADVKYYAPQEITGVPVELSRSALQMPVVTAALMICRKADFMAVGGFCEEYFYGLEDVDLCLKISQKLGKKVICDLNSSAIHNRSATRESKFAEKQPTKFYTSDIHAKNRSAYIRRFGRQLRRKILRSLIEGKSFYRQQPLRVTFVVTEADINTAAGDYFTALELGIWLRKKFGWEVFFITIGNYRIPGTDVLVVMRHDYNIRKLVDGNPGLLTVAWIRNRTDEWLERPEFDDYNIVFASSQKIIDHLYDVRKRKAILLPIATNPDRFSPDMMDFAHTSEVVFTGSYHGAVRGAVAMMNLDNTAYQFAIYGYNWEKYPPFARYSRGSLRYDLLGKAYASSKIVIDDSHPVTRDWNSLNSRIFDAIACGKVVITNCIGGARELFGDKIPTFSTREELNMLIGNLLENDANREQQAQELREIVLTKHTYSNRADTFKDSLYDFLKEDALRFAIKIGVSKIEELEQWGDYHFALGIKRALEKQGHFARIDILPDWNGGLSSSDDVVVVLRGLSRYKPHPTAINLMWLISHPDEVSIAEMREYDHVFVASESYAKRLEEQLGNKVSPLLQCTDPELFYPDVDEELDIPDVLFVGNSRGQRREVVQNALDTGIDFGVYGDGWKGILPAERVLGEYIPNKELRRYYSTAKVLFNDHWPDMRMEGFISNRIFDAGACGASIVTDDINAGRELFGNMIGFYRNAHDFEQCISSALTPGAERQSRAESISRFIIENHSFDKRIAEILCAVANIQNNRDKT